MDRTRSSLEFRIPADTRYVSLIRRGIRSLAESAGFSRQEVSDVEVAVSEAVTNSVEHGSPCSDCAAVLIKCLVSGEGLVVEVEDESPADHLPSPVLSGPADERGRGILMMHSLMDECEGQRTDSGMRVRMAKMHADQSSAEPVHSQ